MWMFTKLGFYSVTVNPSNSNQMQIRARLAEDLERLIDFARRYQIKIDDQIKEFPVSDYPYRVFMPQAEWPMLAYRLAEDIDYTNFKATVRDQYRHSLYMRVWLTMQELTHRSSSNISLFHSLNKE